MTLRPAAVAAVFSLTASTMLSPLAAAELAVTLFASSFMVFEKGSLQHLCIKVESELIGTSELSANEKDLSCSFSQ